MKILNKLAEFKQWIIRIVMVRIFKARTRDWWFKNYGWTGVNYEDMPDKLITKKEFWREYSPTNGC